MEHQYPAAISGDESMLAELMLPDQTHVRSQDWTIFFLHKDTSDDDEEEGGKKKKKRKSKYRGNEEGADIQHENPDEASDGDSSDDEEGGEGPPLMYVLNLVNTKQDNTVRRYVYPARSSLPYDGLTWQQRRCRQGNGDLYKAFIPSHLQSKIAPDKGWPKLTMAAPPSPRIGRLLQIALPRNTRLALRRRELHGPLVDAQVVNTGASHSAVKQHEGDVSRKV